MKQAFVFLAFLGAMVFFSCQKETISTNGSVDFVVTDRDSNDHHGGPHGGNGGPGNHNDDSTHVHNDDSTHVDHPDSTHVPHVDTTHTPHHPGNDTIGHKKHWGGHDHH